MTRRLYFIAATNRTGSTWLCRMLSSTGTAGCPRELLRHRPIAEQWAESLDKDPHGVKLWHGVLATLWPLVDPAERRRARWVWLVRRDTWRQAVSQYRARSSGVWHVTGGTQQEIPAAHRDVAYDAAAIAAERLRLRRAAQAWRTWFTAHQLRPLLILYEDLAAEPEKTVRRILRHLRLDEPATIDTGGMTILRDEITDAWLDRLRRDGEMQANHGATEGTEKDV